MQSLQRNLAKPVTKKLLVTTEMLGAIVDVAEKSGSLVDWRLATTCVSSYAAFLRFDELVHIRAADVKFNDEFMTISISKSKTDQLRKGDEVILTKRSSKLCPVSNCRNTWHMLGSVLRTHALFFGLLSRQNMGRS